MKILLTIFLITLLFQASLAQTLTFHGRGAALKIDKVKVTQSATGASKVFDGNMVKLLILTGIGQVNSPEIRLTSYPNPSHGKALVACNSSEQELVTLKLHNANGQVIATRKAYLNIGLQQFSVTTPSRGIHFLSVSGRKTMQTIKLLSLQTENQPAFISLNATSQTAKASLKSGLVSTDDEFFTYNWGDSLMFECFSGALSSKVSFVPKGDRAYGVQFCNSQFNLNAPCQENYIEYSPNVKQEVLGWGCFPSYHKDISWGAEWGIANKPNAQTALYSDLGINVIRVSLDGYQLNGKSEIDKTRLAEVKKHIQAAKSKGITRWIASLWTPPLVLKEYQEEAGYAFVDKTGKILKLENPWETNIYQDSLIQSGITYYKKHNRLKANSEGAYCKYMIDILNYLNASNVPLPEQLSFQNEPSFVEAWYGGCVYEQEQYVRMAKLLRKKLDEANMQSIKIAAGDHGSLVDAFKLMEPKMAIFNTDSEFNSSVDHLSIHSYDDNNRWDTDTKRKINNCAELNQTALALGKELWMTEYTSLFHADFIPSLKGNDFGIASHITRHLIRDMLLMPINNWLFWVAYTKDDGDGVFLTGADNALKKKMLYHVFSKLWKNVTPDDGYRVIELISNDKDIKTSNGAALEMIGFEGKTNTVVLVVNPTSKDKPNFKIAGIAKGAVADVFTSTATTDMLANGTVENVQGESLFVLKANSINILIFR